MINKYTNKQRGLLAVIMAMVMVFAGAAFVAAEVDADEEDPVIVYVSSTGNDTYDGTSSAPYKTVAGAISKDSTTNGSTIILLSNVDWSVSESTVSKEVTIKSDVEGEKSKNYTITLRESVTVNVALNIEGCTIATTTDDTQFVIGSSGSIYTKGCIFTTASGYESTPDYEAPRAVNAMNGQAMFEGTTFNDMKVTVGERVIFVKCLSVYINTGKTLTVNNYTNQTLNTTDDATPVSSEPSNNIYIDTETDVNVFKVHQNAIINIAEGMILEADKILVKDHDIGATDEDQSHQEHLGAIYGPGSISGSFEVYESDAEGGVDYADVIIGNDLKFVGRNSIAEDVHVEIESAIITSDATLSVAGKVALKNIEDTPGSLINNGKIFVTSEKADIPVTIKGTGSVDNSAVQEDAYFGGSVVTENTIFSSNQIVNIVADTELKDALLIIEGTLIVPEGVTLTLSGTSAIWIYGAESKLYNNGTIVVESEGKTPITGYDPRGDDDVPVALGIIGGYAENNGSIYLSYEPETTTSVDYFSKYSMHIENAVFENNGDIQIDEFNTLGICVNDEDEVGTPDNGEKTILNNNADASITVEGMLVGYVDNASTITIDGTAWGYISLVSSDAVVDIVSIQTQGTGLRIDNYGFFIKKGMEVGTSKIEKTDTTPSIEAGSYITLKTNTDGDYTFAIEGVVVGAAFTTDKDKNYFPYIDISGEVSGESTKEPSGTDDVVEVGSIALKGDISVTTTLTVSNEVDINVVANSTATLTVSGEMTLDVDSGTNEFGVTTVKVTGKLTSTEKLTDGGFTASYYEIKEDKVNNIAEQHIYTNFADAVSAAPKKITVFGDVKVSTEITVPTGIEITFTDGTLEVTTDGKLTVADGSKMKLGSEADVKGVLHFENKKNLNGDVKSDVVITDDKSVTYCGIAYAMANATAGQTVTVSEGAADPLTIDKDVTIPAGVILDTGAVNGVKVCKGATLTIDGTLDLGAAELTIELADVPQTAAGAKPAGKVVLNGTIVSEDEQDEEIPGAYYTMTVKGVTGFYIEPVATAAPKIATVDDLTMEIKAFTTELALGNVSFTGTTEDSAVVKIVGKVNGNITLDLASIEFDGEAFKGTITNGTGTFASEGTAVDGFKVKSTTSDDVKKLTVSGTFTADSMKTITLSGDVTLSKFTGNSVTVDGNVVVIDTTSDDGVSTITSKLKVNGTVTVDNDATLTVYGEDGDENVISYAEVLGSITAVSATDSKGAGKVNVTDLYLGLTKKMVTGAGAAISENVTVTGLMYVVDGSTFPADMVKDKKYVALYVEDALWMTVYNMGTGTASISVTEIPVENVELVDWVDDKGVSKVEMVDTDGDDEGDTPKIVVNDQKLYAKINYEVYVVSVQASVGIDDVYLDGVLMSNVGLIYTATVAAGTHTISYTLANGYTGEAKMLVDGKEVSGYTFITEGKFEGVTYDITLQGIEKIPTEVGGTTDGSQPNDDGMTLTDILLIVLVVLIVIMAIIVALRMMRS